MNPFVYLTTPDPLFGWIEWILFISQIVLLLVGGYFAFLYRDTNQIKLQALQRFGYVLLALSALGVLLGGLKLGLVEPFTSRVWMFLVVVFEIALGVYALVYSQRIYPQQVAAAKVAARPTRPAVRAGAARKPLAPNGTPIAPVEVPIPRVAPGRRDSRRERKRRKR